MRIVASRVARIGGEAPRAVGAARATITARHGLLLTLTGDNGLEGLGEASPLPGYSPDSLEDAGAALHEIHRELADLPLDRTGIDAIEHASSRTERLPHSPAARFAVETALFDLLGKTHGVPMHRLLGAPAPATLARSGLLSAPLDAERAVIEAKTLYARGIRVIKAKVGGPAGLDAEIAALLAVRAALPAFVLRLDANGAWSTAEARDALTRLLPLRAEWIEEPCAGEALLEFGEAAIPWAADESLRVLGARLAGAPGCAAVILKPALLGLLGARRLAAHAQVAVVTHLFDGPVALAAAAELALAIGGNTAHGLDPHVALDAWPALAVPQLAGKADIRPSSLPGLGLEAAAAQEGTWAR